MKKLYIFALVATMFAACATDAIDGQSVKVEEQTPDTLVGTFEGDDSRIQLQNGKTVWTKGDEVSVFYLSNANQKWQYQGETGERTGNLKRVANADGSQEMSSVVVVYPYNENYYINHRTCNVKASLPATQTYLKDSYGLDGNIMVSRSEYNQFSLKNVCGWLKVQLIGSGDKVQSIKLKGNNGEQVAGEIYINSADATSTLASEMGGADDGENSAGGNLVFDDTILTEVVLNCGEGVTLSNEPTAFYIALPPQTFSKGLTVEVLMSDGMTMTKSTSNSIVIERNAIQPMTPLTYCRITPIRTEIKWAKLDDNIIGSRSVLEYQITPAEHAMAISHDDLRFVFAESTSQAIEPTLEIVGIQVVNPANGTIGVTVDARNLADSFYQGKSSYSVSLVASSSYVYARSPYVNLVPATATTVNCLDVKLINNWEDSYMIMYNDLGATHTILPNHNIVFSVNGSGSYTIEAIRNMGYDITFTKANPTFDFSTDTLSNVFQIILDGSHPYLNFVTLRLIEVDRNAVGGTVTVTYSYNVCGKILSARGQVRII